MVRAWFGGKCVPRMKESELASESFRLFCTFFFCPVAGTVTTLKEKGEVRKGRNNSEKQLNSIVSKQDVSRRMRLECCHSVWVFARRKLGPELSPRLVVVCHERVCMKLHVCVCVCLCSKNLQVG